MILPESLRRARYPFVRPVDIARDRALAKAAEGSDAAEGRL
jgi:hypothetical protein